MRQQELSYFVCKDASVCMNLINVKPGPVLCGRCMRRGFFVVVFTRDSRASVFLGLNLVRLQQMTDDTNGDERHEAVRMLVQKEETEN